MMISGKTTIIMQRKGVTVEYAQRERRRSTLIAALLVKFGKTDGMLCGTYASYDIHLDFVKNVISLKKVVVHCLHSMH